MAMQGKPLPLHVQQEFVEYLKCGRLEHGFLRVQWTHCHHEHWWHSVASVVDFTPGILPSALRASLWLFKIAPGDFVAANSKHRVDVTPAKCGKSRPHEEQEDKTPAQRHQSMTWAQRLKRVFNLAARGLLGRRVEC